MKLLALSLLLLALLPGIAQAQGDTISVVSAPILDSYPQLSAYFDIHAPDGDFINGLQASQITILEDGKSLPVSGLQEIRLGMQISLVFNATPAMASRNSLGVSRFDMIREAAIRWAEAQRETTSDEYNLFTNFEIGQTRLNNSALLSAEIAGFEANLRQVTTSLEPLSQAIRHAEESTFAQGAEKAILYITGEPAIDDNAAIKDLQVRAQDAGVKIFVWMVAPKDRHASPEAAILNDLGLQTGGTFFAFSGSESLPDIASFFEPLRYIYLLSWRSSITGGEKHSVAVQTRLVDNEVVTSPMVFTLKVLPPNPLFVGLTSQIIRTLPEESREPDASLTPLVQVVDFLVEFPDGHPRAIQKATLYVDQSPAVILEQDPFEVFAWNLTEYLETGAHSLQIEVVDEVGLSARSVEFPVTVIVSIPPRGVWSILQSRGGVFLLLAVGIAAGILLQVLLTSYRRQRKLALDSSAISGSTDPVNQRVPIEPIILRDAPLRPAPPPGQSLTARLIPMDALSRRLDAEAVPILDVPILFGRDAVQVLIHVDHSSVEAVHARLWKSDDGRFYLADTGSVSGTWVNYVPVPKEGLLLHSGDVIRIGPRSFTFME